MGKPSSQKAPRGRNAPPSSEAITDPRFANFHTDPRFRLPSKKHTRVQLDDRFARVLKDDEFSTKASVDRYGRKLVKGTGKKDLERFYRIDDEELKEDEEKEDDTSESGDDDDDDDEDEEVQPDLPRGGRSYDPARGGGFSSSEESSDEEDEAEPDIYEEPQFPDMQIDQQGDVPMGEVSSRIAVVNLDWDNIRAVDLMAVFSSFCPSNGRIRKISVYPSEFGRERMEREEMDGPPREIFSSSTAAPRRGDEDNDESSSEGDEVDEVPEDEDEEKDQKIKASLLREDKGEEFDSAKLRHYQLERLRYFYAVLTLSSPEAAKSIYDATDGTEYLTTANFFDLRFIPDDVSFDDDKPRDECTQLPDNYKPNNFVTNALQHSKVKLTWDADDGVRKQVQQKAFSGSRADIEQNDLKAYLGSDSSEEHDDDDAAAGDDHTLSTTTNGPPKLSKKDAERARLRAALGLADAVTSTASKSKNATVGPVGDMQITFSSGLSSNDKKSSVFENEPIVEETTVEKYVRREKERKARRKEKMKAGREGGDDSSALPANADDDADDDNEKGVDEEGKDEEDLGFEDPFFATAPAADGAAPGTNNKKAQKKADRLARRAERQAADEAASKEKAALSLLMADDNTATSTSNPLPADAALKVTGQHFSLPTIIAAEKALAKASTSAKHKKHLSKTKRKLLEDMQDSGGKGGEEAGLQPGFTMDVKDPRFERVYVGGGEWAIDPSSSRFSGTKGMREVLEEGRRRRGTKGEEGGEREGKKRKGDGGDGDGNGEGVDVERMIAKVKKRRKQT